MSLTSLVTRESLQTLETSYNQSQGTPTESSFPQMQAAASRFLGRLWAGASFNLNNSIRPFSVYPQHTVRRSASKQSMTSTLNSIESTSDVSTAPTEVSAGENTRRQRPKSIMFQNNDRDLHTQIEDLLTALSEAQHQNVDLTRDLQKEREEREEDQDLAKQLLRHVKLGRSEIDIEGEEERGVSAEEIVAKAEERFSNSRPLSIPQTKHQLQDDANRWKEMQQLEASRCKDLGRRIDEQEFELTKLNQELREARSRIQDSYRDKQRLGRTILELRPSKNSAAHRGVESFSDATPSAPNTTGGHGGDTHRSPAGLRELKLLRNPPTHSPAASTASSATATTDTSPTSPPRFNKRSSSLGLQNVLSSTETYRPAPASSAATPDEAILIELVHAKTAEAVAKQELEEVKLKLEALRRLTGSGAHRPAGGGGGNRNSLMVPLFGGGGGGGGNGESGNNNISRVNTEPTKLSPLSAGPNSVNNNNNNNSAVGAGFFSGWGKRMSFRAP